MQKRLNVFLLTDLEGVAGVDSIEDMERGSERYAHSCALLCAEINLAVKACFDSGADRVYYLDGHGGGGNVKEAQIDPRAVKCTIADWCQLLQEGKIDCMVELGAHARAGTVGGFLDHTISSKEIFSIKVNGVEMSEFSLHAIVCARYGVPVVGLVGDEVACKQAREYVPSIVVGAVKNATCRNVATTYPNADQILYDTVCRSLQKRSEVTCIPYSEPLLVEYCFYRTDMCEATLARTKDPVLRVDARTLQKHVNSVTTYFDLRM